MQALNLSADCPQQKLNSFLRFYCRSALAGEKGKHWSAKFLYLAVYTFLITQISHNETIPTVLNYVLNFRNKMKFSFYFLTLNVEIFSFHPFKPRFISFKGLIDDKWFLLQKACFTDTFLFKYPFKLQKLPTVYKAITEL